ncbi:MAG: hypothetical protein EXS08_10165 [Planctomycetes bacterium]|nr:hypothetical protein [Planctomycetota bacterium]
MKESLPPIVRAVSVSWAPAAAFKRFTEDFASWWPSATHSIGGKERLKRIVFECKPDGLIFEEHTDGRRFQWGVVLEWQPPTRVTFRWHPSRDQATAQEVALTFHPEGTGTKLELVSSGWENWGKGAKGARRGYDMGWGYVLEVWAGRRTVKKALIDVLAKGIGLAQKLRGGTAAAVARAGGEMRSVEPG